MGILYILGSILFILLNANRITDAFRLIFIGAFTPEAIIGGGIGIQQAMCFGIAGGLFSNEAGMGLLLMLYLMLSILVSRELLLLLEFFAVFLVVTLTALVMLTSGILQN